MIAPALLGTDQTLTYLSISQSTLDRLVRAGSLPRLHIGHKSCYRVADLQQFMETLDTAAQGSQRKDEVVAL